MNGRRFTGPSGNSLFLPAAGNRWFGELYFAGTDGGYWSSSLNTGYPNGAWLLYFGSGSTLVSGNDGRDLGFSVRPVLEN